HRSPLAPPDKSAATFLRGTAYPQPAPRFELRVRCFPYSCELRARSGEQQIHRSALSSYTPLVSISLSRRSLEAPSSKLAASLHRGGAAHNLDNLFCNLCLPRPVHHQRQRID